MTIQERLELFLSKEPQLADEVFIAPGATVIGDVRLGARSSVWYGCVLRGDINFIQIGEATNVQDGSVIHLADDFPVIIGDYVTIGHSAVVHACVVEDECLIGMNATILDGAVIGRRSIVAAGSLVPQGMQVPPGSLVAGVPAKVKRSLGSFFRGGLRERILCSLIEPARSHLQSARGEKSAKSIGHGRHSSV